MKDKILEDNIDNKYTGLKVITATYVTLLSQHLNCTITIYLSLFD
jgi:hypothetical protein